MPTSRIKITYDQRTNGEPGADTHYFIRATVSASVTTPEALKTCLVVVKGSITESEYMEGVGTKAEIVDTATLLPALPSTVNWFESESFTPGCGVVVGDIVRISEISDRWWIYGYAPDTTYDAVIAQVDLNNRRVRVATAFPSFGRSMVFSVLHDSTPILTATDGTANRDYTGLGTAQRFRASWGISNFETDLDAAQAWRASADADAAALVRAYDSDTYTSIDEEIYE